MHSPRYRYRLYLLTLLILVGTGTLLVQLYHVQIEQQAYYREKVPSNSTVKVREPGIRGEIKDRNGITLAGNTQSFIVYFNLAEIHRAYVKKFGKTLKRTYIVSRKGAKKKIERTDIAGMVNQLIRPTLARYGLDAKYSAKAMEAHYNTHGGLVPFVFRKNISYKEFALFAELNLDLPGIDIAAAPKRVYPYGALASHIIGFIKQWKKGDIPKNYRHYIGDPYGEDGVERTMNDELTGREGIKEILKNEKGKTIRTIDYQPPAKGSDIYLTIDARIQYLTETVLKRAGKAAAIVMDPNTGEILAMASVPNFDPNDFIPSISTKRYAFYRENKAAPLMNRAISNFAPGSTFKLPAAIAGCKYGLYRETNNCIGYTSYGKTKIHCWKHSGHGVLALSEAIQRSCNPFFMHYTNKIGYKKVVEVYQMLGLGSQTGIELPRENAGVVPGSQRWKTRFPNERMTDALTGMMGIGQGYCQATPLQLAAVVSTIANGGKYYQPHLIKKITNSLTNTTKITTPTVKVNLLKEGVLPKHLATIRYGMRLAATAIGGTARRACPEDVIIGAKTGTAQTTDMGVKTHVAWTVAFAPFKNPRYVVVVAVKRGGSGGKVAGPLVKLILTALLEKDKGQRLHLAKTKPYRGHLELIPEIVVDEENPLTELFDDGETGDEAASIKTSSDKKINQPRNQPTPSITPEVDERGSVIPKAIPVP